MTDNQTHARNGLASGKNQQHDLPGCMIKSRLVTPWPVSLKPTQKGERCFTNVLLFYLWGIKLECRLKDSNLRPSVYDTDALPAELRRHDVFHHNKRNYTGGKSRCKPLFKQNGHRDSCHFQPVDQRQKQKNQPAWTGCLAPDVRLELTTT